LSLSFSLCLLFGGKFGRAVAVWGLVGFLFVYPAAIVTLPKAGFEVEGEGTIHNLAKI
jgi:hypothetical protein